MEEIAPAAVAPADNYKLRFPDGTERTVPEVLQPPYAFGFDAAAGFLTDFHQFDPRTPLVMLKSSFSNVMEAFVHDYEAQLNAIYQAAETTCKKLGQTNPMSADFMRNLKIRARGRLEEGQHRLMQWDGKSELMVQLPYCLLAQQGEGDEATINFRASRPYVNGVIWVARWQ